MKVRKRFLALCMAFAVAVMPGSAVTGHAAQSETAGASAEEFLAEELRQEDADLEKDADLVISSADDLKQFAANVTSGDTYEGKTVRLSGDIAFDGVTLNNFETIGGKRQIKFEGTFDGRGFTISGIVQSGEVDGGLFYFVGSNGVVKNLTVKNAKIQCSGCWRAGGIATYNYGQIQNCRVTGSTISCSGNVGGIVGCNGGISGSGLVNACEVEETVIQGLNNRTGGIVGEATVGTIMNCRSSAVVSGYHAGGIAGYSSKHSIVNCANLGEVTVGSIYGEGGGIIGFSGGSNTVQNCYNSGVITQSDSPRCIGGLIGYSANDTDTVIDSYYSPEGCELAYGGKNTPGVQSGVLAKTEAQMQSQDFLNLLNKNRSQNPDWIPWLFRSGSVYPAHDRIFDIRTNSAHGKVDYGTEFAWTGQKVTFTVTPDKYYEVKSVTVKNSAGTAYTVEKTSAGYSFVMPSCSVDVTVTYSLSMPISECTASLSKTSYTYSGAAKKPAVTVKNGSVTLKSGTDYTVKYASNVNVGTAKVTVTGKGSYTGSKVLTFQINKAKQTISTSSSSYTKVDGAAAFKLGAKVKKGNGKLSYTSSNKKVVTVSKDGKVTVKGPGYAEISVTASGTANYKKTVKKVAITIKPKKPTLNKPELMSGGRLKVSWKSAVPGATGYIVEYSLYSDFKNSKQVKVTDGKAKSVTLKGLTKNKNYYVRIYAYKTSTKDGVKKQIKSEPSPAMRSGKIKK